MRFKEFLSFPWKEMLFPGDGDKRAIALTLFAASIALTDHYFKVNIDAIGDICTNILHRILPLSWQNKIRDSGFIRWMVDHGAYVAALETARLDWQLVLDFWTVTSKLKRFQYGETADHIVEIFQPEDSSRYHKNLVHGAGSHLLCHGAQQATFSTLVFVHGGAWGCGRPWHYRMVANGLGTLLGVQNVVLVGYPTYPLSTILQQRDFVTAALRYIQSNTEVTRILSQNNTTADSARSAHNIVLCGHSSGANICALSLLDNLHTSSDSSTISPFTALNVHTFIGLAGVYDIGKHYLFESNRGVHVISPMCSAACGRKCFGMCSPTVVARGVKRQLDAKQASAGMNASYTASSGAVADAAVGAERRAMGMPHTVLIHGWGDMVVPYSSSAEFGTALQDLGVQVDVIGVKLNHMEPLDDCTRGAYTPHSEVNTVLRKAL